MNLQIQYINVGRENYSGIESYPFPYEPTPDDATALAFRVARKYLVSANVEAVYDQEKNIGTIYAGWHVAGHFKVVKWT